MKWIARGVCAPCSAYVQAGLFFSRAHRVDLCTSPFLVRAPPSSRQYQEAFVHYLIAAEQGNKEGQASLAWLLDKSLAAAPSGSSPFDLVRWLWGRLRSTGSSSGSSSVGATVDASRRGAEAGASDSAGAGMESSRGERNRRSGIGGVVDTVRELGGDPEAMARRYRRLAAEQGDSEAR